MSWHRREHSSAARSVEDVMTADLAILNDIGKQHEPRFLVAPERYAGFADDRPDHSVPRRRGAIDVRRLRRAARVRMEVARYLRASTACFAVRVNQRLRIDLEPAPSIPRDIGRRARRLDRLGAAQQDAAALLGRRSLGLREYALERRS